MRLRFAIALALVCVFATDGWARPRRRPVRRPPPAKTEPKKPPPSEAAPPASTPSTPAVDRTPAGGEQAAQRESRIEFDERLVQGQTASGAIYLFERAAADFNSMIQVPESFRERTVKKLMSDGTKR